MRYSPSRPLPFSLAVVLRPAPVQGGNTPPRGPKVSRRTPHAAPRRAIFSVRASGGDRQTEPFLLVLLEQQSQILVGRLKRALDHQATAVPIHRHALGVGVGCQDGQLVMRVATRW